MSMLQFTALSDHAEKLHRFEIGSGDFKDILKTLRLNGAFFLCVVCWGKGVWWVELFLWDLFIVKTLFCSEILPVDGWTIHNTKQDHTSNYVLKTLQQNHF